jgi:hypothetical protein
MCEREREMNFLRLQWKSFIFSLSLFYLEKKTIFSISSTEKCEGWEIIKMMDQFTHADFYCLITNKKEVSTQKISQHTNYFVQRKQVYSTHSMQNLFFFMLANVEREEESKDEC